MSSGDRDAKKKRAIKLEQVKDYMWCVYICGYIYCKYKRTRPLNYYYLL